MGICKGKRELVEILKSSVKTAPKEALESCIAAVNAANNASFADERESVRKGQRQQQEEEQRNRQEPKCAYAFRLLKLIVLQLNAIPKVTYVITAVLTVMQFVPFVKLSSEDALAYNGILNSIILLIFAWHLMIIPAENMKELEKSCKYSYAQLFFARLLCIGVVGMIVMAAAAISCVGSIANDDLGAALVLTVLLPTVCAAFNALLWANYISSSEFAIMSVYAVSAFVIGMISELISEAGTFVLCIIVGISLLGIAFQTMRIMNRRVYDEAYNY